MQELRNYFRDISDKTFSRDIALLKRAGVPIRFSGRRKAFVLVDEKGDESSHAPRREPDLDLIWANDDESREIVRDFFYIWIIRTFPSLFTSEDSIKYDVACAIRKYISSKPYHIFPVEFSDVIADEYNAIICMVRSNSKNNDSFLPFYLNENNVGERIGILESVIDDDWVASAGRDINDSLNQRFLRARYGGKKNTVPGCKDMYFRISSVGYNWFPIIRDFVEKHPDPIETVTIIKDYESTGCEKYYMDFDNHPYNKMPLVNFMSGQCNTNLLANNDADERFNVHRVLANGGSVQQLRMLRMNYGWVLDKIQFLKHQEEAKLSEGLEV